MFGITDSLNTVGAPRLMLSPLFLKQESEGFQFPDSYSPNFFLGCALSVTPFHSHTFSFLSSDCVILPSVLVCLTSTCGSERQRCLFISSPSWGILVTPAHLLLYFGSVRSLKGPNTGGMLPTLCYWEVIEPSRDGIQ